MAKIRGPLFSFKASGSTAHGLTFRSVGDKTFATRKIIRTTTATNPMMQSRATAHEAVVMWNAAEPSFRQRWTAAARLRGLPPFGFYLQQHIDQGVQPGGTPIIPKGIV
jgi:hypothetical protein